MSPVATRPRPASSPSTQRVPYGIAAFSALVLLVVGMALSNEPARVDRLTVVNRSPYDLSIDVRPSRGGPSLALGGVEQHATTIVADVLDQGANWTFVVSGQGRVAGQFTRSRAALAAAGWRLDLPDSLAAALEADGAPPSP